MFYTISETTLERGGGIESKLIQNYLILAQEKSDA